MVQKIQGAQRDFSSGEIDVTLKRSDDQAARKTGLRQLSNMRILNSGAVQNRSGRTALFPVQALTRTEKVTMSAGNTFSLAFGAALMKVFDSTGAAVAVFTVKGNGSPLPWALSTIGQIVFVQIGLSIYITFPGMRPQVVSWNGVSTWSIADYAELLNGNQKRTLFYRISPQGVTLAPGAQTGSGVALVASAPLFVAGHVGTRMRFVGRQMLITAVTNSTNAVVTIEESLPGSQVLTFGVDPRNVFNIGDVVTGTVSGAQGIVTAVTATTVQVQLLNNNQSVITTFGFPTIVAFVTTDILVGPGGSLAITGGVSAISSPVACAVWDEEVMNDLQGYPASCFADQFRLGFCNFPTVPGGIAWAAINSPTDLYVVGATQPSGAIFELTPDKVQVLYIVPGPESAEFVFCDKKLYYIKIDASNPLRPGSVGFSTLSGDGCAQVQPRASQELILYVNAGRNSVMAIFASGAFYRPFNTINLCDFHSHLFTNIQLLAIPTADGTFNERYVYVLNSDNSLVIGKYAIESQSAVKVGWGPWNGAGVVSWVSTLAADVVFTTTYFGTFAVCEILNDSYYLDSSVLVNNLPIAMVPTVPGQGPLWWAANQSISLMDQGTRSMGTYQIDINGFIVPQNNAGENLVAQTLIAGLPWTAIIEPFCPDANPGADAHQRMFPRRVARFAAYAVHSTGFVMGRLFSGRITRTSPPLGTLMNFRRFPAWNQDDDPTLPPPLRETTERIRPLGRSFDPRVAVIKDSPGPLQLLELGIECTI